MVPSWILTVGLVVLVVGAAYGTHMLQEGVVTGSLVPVVWWYVDDYQIHTKEWVSFEDRATREPVEPYLGLCRRKAQAAFGDVFKMEIVTGRAAALKLLAAAGCPIPDGAERTPPALWMAWVRCAMLAYLGGLWLDGSVLVIGSGREIQQRILPHDVLSFGSDPDESLVSASQGEAGPAAGRSAGWAAAAGHPIWMGMTKHISDVIQQGDPSWSSFEARRALRNLWVPGPVDRKAEVSRSVYGKRLQYEDLFETTDWPTGTTEGGLWVPLPDGRDKLNMASPFLWFTRLSEEQILESEFLWARLARTK